MADITFNVDAALAKLGELVSQHGQQALDAAVSVERASSVNALAQAGGWLVVSAAVGWVAVRLFKKAGSGEYDDQIIYLPFGVVTLAGFAAAAFGVVLPLFNAWVWIGIFNPKLALAHDVMLRMAGIG